MNKLREEIQALFSGTECTRPAAVRRSLLEGFLYATDLPQAADAEAVSAFRREAEKAGWRTEEASGWIQLDRVSGASPADVYRGPYGTEAQCCAGILRRHPGTRKNGDREMRMLLKAGDEGPEAYERVCRILHREWAAALRKKEALPDLPEEYFRRSETEC